MKHYFILFFSLMSLSIASFAQHDNFSIAGTVGISTPILDNGVTLHLGINAARSFTDYIALEAQAAYLYTNVTNSFLSDKGLKVHSLNFLIGPRVYLTPKEKKARLFLNLLFGANYNNETYDDGRVFNDVGLGFSGGAYVTFTRFLIGLSYDTPQNPVLKLGYVF